MLRACAAAAAGASLFTGVGPTRDSIPLMPNGAGLLQNAVAQSLCVFMLGPTVGVHLPV